MSNGVTYKCLSPMQVRILFKLGDNPRSIKQVAEWDKICELLADYTPNTKYSLSNRKLIDSYIWII